MILDAARLQALLDGVLRIETLVAETPANEQVDTDQQSANELLQTLRNEKRIVLQILGNASYTDAQKLQLINETLGPQE